MLTIATAALLFLAASAEAAAINYDHESRDTHDSDGPYEHKRGFYYLDLHGKKINDDSSWAPSWSSFRDAHPAEPSFTRAPKPAYKDYHVPQTAIKDNGLHGTYMKKHTTPKTAKIYKPTTYTRRKRSVRSVQSRPKKLSWRRSKRAIENGEETLMRLADALALVTHSLLGQDGVDGETRPRPTEKPAQEQEEPDQKQEEPDATVEDEPEDDSDEDEVDPDEDMDDDEVDPDDGEVDSDDEVDPDVKHHDEDEEEFKDDEVDPDDEGGPKDDEVDHDDDEVDHDDDEVDTKDDDEVDHDADEGDSDEDDEVDPNDDEVDTDDDDEEDMEDPEEDVKKLEKKSRKSKKKSKKHKKSKKPKKKSKKPKKKSRSSRKPKVRPEHLDMDSEMDYYGADGYSDYAHEPPRRRYQSPSYRYKRSAGLTRMDYYGYDGYPDYRSYRQSRKPRPSYMRSLEHHPRYRRSAGLTRSQLNMYMMSRAVRARRHKSAEGHNRFVNKHMKGNKGKKNH